MYGLVLGLHVARFLREPLWKKHVPLQSSDHRNRRPLDEGVLGEIIREYTKHITSFYDALSAHRVRYFVVSASPMRTDHVSLKRLSPDDVRFVSEKYRTYVRDYLRERGIATIMPPLQSLEEGLPRRDLWTDRAGDHHGNLQYGHMMLTSILSTSDRTGASPVQSSAPAHASTS